MGLVGGKMCRVPFKDFKILFITYSLSDPFKTYSIILHEPSTNKPSGLHIADSFTHQVLKPHLREPTVWYNAIILSRVIYIYIIFKQADPAHKKFDHYLMGCTVSVVVGAGNCSN